MFNLMKEDDLSCSAGLILFTIVQECNIVALMIEVVVKEMKERHV